MQAMALVDEEPYKVDLAEWKSQCGADMPASQYCNVLSGYSFFLDALEDDRERRLAKEIIRSLGGQVLLCK
jgi:hypothetical protein